MSTAGNDNGQLPANYSFFRSQLFYRRLMLLLCAVTVSVPFILASRPVKDEVPRAAFSVPSPVHGYVKINGNVRHPGVYPMSAKLMTIDAIKMAEPDAPGIRGLPEGQSDVVLKNGMAINISISKDKTAIVTRSSMSSSERLVLNVPLDINAMTAADFDKVPGIGPTLAQRIVIYRHKNGDSMSVKDLLSVDGIGESSFNRLKQYF
jgi:competence protein ComEA